MATNKNDSANIAKEALQKSDKKEETIFSLVKAQRAGFKMALPKDFDEDRFTRICLTVLNSNKKLALCEPYSILGALMTCAQLGLEPNTPLKEAYIIPYSDKAQFQISYRGLEKLAWNSGLIEFLDYDIICENDEIIYSKGLNPTFIHKPLLKGKRGEPYAYYAVAGIIGGGRAIVLKSKEEVLAHAKRFSKTWNGKNFGGTYNKQGIWDTDFEAMAIKTVLIELIDKKLPKRTTNEALKFVQAANIDNSIISLDKSQVSSNSLITIDDMDVKTLDELDNIEEAEVIEQKEAPKEEPKEMEMPDFLR